MVGEAKLQYDLLLGRIAAGERPLVIHEFEQLLSSGMSPVAKNGDMVLERDPLEVARQREIYAAALGYPMPGGMVIIKDA